METLLTIGLVTFGIYFFSTKTALENLQFVEDGVSFDVSNPLKILITLTVMVQNPTSTGFDLMSLAGSIKLNGNGIGNVSYFLKTHIAANSEVPIDLKFSVNDISLVAPIMDYIEGNPKPMVLVIDGVANVNNIPLPITLSFNPIPVTQ